jgi:hypothetical protein
MASKICTIRQYDKFLDLLANPNPDEIYQLLPQGYKQIQDVQLNLNNALIYADIYVNDVPKLYMSFVPELLGGNEVFLSPILIHTDKPIILDKKILENPLPINIITRKLFEKMVGTHIPKILYKWKADPVTEINTVS